MNIFAVTSPAGDTGLLTLAEIRKATGSTTAGDSDLRDLGARVSSVIARACQVAVDGVTAPTLRLETVSDTIELECARSNLFLSRRPVVSIVSVIEGGATLTTDDYRADVGAGLLQRRKNGRPATWRAAADIVVSYSAGWANVPDDLKLAASKIAFLLWAETTRDPNVRRIRTEGVDDVEYWTAPASVLSPEIADILQPYTNHMRV